MARAWRLVRVSSVSATSASMTSRSSRSATWGAGAVPGVGAGGGCWGEKDPAAPADRVQCQGPVAADDPGQRGTPRAVPLRPVQPPAAVGGVGVQGLPSTRYGRTGSRSAGTANPGVGGDVRRGVVGAFAKSDRREMLTSEGALTVEGRENGLGAQGRGVPDVALGCAAKCRRRAPGPTAPALPREGRAAGSVRHP